MVSNTTDSPGIQSTMAQSSSQPKKSTRSRQQADVPDRRIPIVVRVVTSDQWLRLRADVRFSVGALKDDVLSRAGVGPGDSPLSGPLRSKDLKNKGSSRSFDRADVASPYRRLPHNSPAAAVLPSDLPKAYLARAPNPWQAANPPSETTTTLSRKGSPAQGLGLSGLPDSQPASWIRAKEARLYLQGDPGRSAPGSLAFVGIGAREAILPPSSSNSNTAAPRAPAMAKSSTVIGISTGNLSQTASSPHLPHKPEAQAALPTSALRSPKSLTNAQSATNMADSAASSSQPSTSPRPVPTSTPSSSNAQATPSSWNGDASSPISSTGAEDPNCSSIGSPARRPMTRASMSSLARVASSQNAAAARAATQNFASSGIQATQASSPRQTTEAQPSSSLPEPLATRHMPGFNKPALTSDAHDGSQDTDRSHVGGSSAASQSELVDPTFETGLDAYALSVDEILSNSSFGLLSGNEEAKKKEAEAREAMERFGASMESHHASNLTVPKSKNRYPALLSSDLEARLESTRAKRLMRQRSQAMDFLEEEDVDGEAYVDDGRDAAAGRSSFSSDDMSLPGHQRHLSTAAFAASPLSRPSMKVRGNALGHLSDSSSDSEHCIPLASRATVETASGSRHKEERFAAPLGSSVANTSQQRPTTSSTSGGSSITGSQPASAALTARDNRDPSSSSDNDIDLETTNDDRLWGTQLEEVLARRRAQQAQGSDMPPGVPRRPRTSGSASSRPGSAGHRQGEHADVSNRGLGQPLQHTAIPEHPPNRLGSTTDKASITGKSVTTKLSASQTMRLAGVNPDEVIRAHSAKHPLAHHYCLQSFNNGIVLEDNMTLAGLKIRPYEILELQMSNPGERVRLPRKAGLLPEWFQNPTATAMPDGRAQPPAAESAVLDDSYLEPYAQVWMYIFQPQKSTGNHARAGLGTWKLRWFMLQSRTLRMYRRKPSRVSLSRSAGSLGRGESEKGLGDGAPVCEWRMDTVRWIGTERADGMTAPATWKPLASDSLTIAFSVPPPGVGYGSKSGPFKVGHTISLRCITNYDARSWYRIFQRAHYRITVEARGGELGVEDLLSQPMPPVTNEDQIRRKQKAIELVALQARTKTTPVAVEVDEWRRKALRRSIISGRGGVVPPGKAGRKGGRNALARTRLRPGGWPLAWEDADEWSDDSADEDYLTLKKVPPPARTHGTTQQQPGLATPEVDADTSQGSVSMAHSTTPSTHRRSQSRPYQHQQHPSRQQWQSLGSPLFSPLSQQLQLAARSPSSASASTGSQLQQRSASSSAFVQKGNTLTRPSTGSMAELRRYHTYTQQQQQQQVASHRPLGELGHSAPNTPASTPAVVLRNKTSQPNPMTSTGDSFSALAPAALPRPRNDREEAATESVIGASPSRQAGRQALSESQDSHSKQARTMEPDIDVEVETAPPIRQLSLHEQRHVPSASSSSPARYPLNISTREPVLAGHEFGADAAMIRRQLRAADTGGSEPNVGPGPSPSKMSSSLSPLRKTHPSLLGADFPSVAASSSSADAHVKIEDKSRGSRPGSASTPTSTRSRSPSVGFGSSVQQQQARAHQQSHRSMLGFGVGSSLGMTTSGGGGGASRSDAGQRERDGMTGSRPGSASSSSPSGTPRRSRGLSLSRIISGRDSGRASGA